MRKLAVFNHLSLDGYFVDAKGEMSWAKAGSGDPEWNAFVAENASGGGVLLFGRVTYDLMIRYWPTPEAMQHAPEVAERMNRMPKMVFSRTLDRATWSNTTLLRGDPVAEVRRMKQEPGDDMVILGSGRLVAALAPHRLIDEYQVVVNPVALGGGRTMFEGIGQPLPLTLTRSRVFGNGNAFLCYEPKG